MNKKTKNNKKGISLIVLVITIIVIIILAAAVILTLTGNNPIENAKQAAYINDLNTFQDELDMYKAKEYAKNLGDFDPSTLNANSENTALLFTYIPSLEGKTKYIAEFSVVAGGLIYTGEPTSVHKTWASIANISDGTAPVVPDTTPPTVTFGTNGGSNPTQVSTTVAVTDAGGLNVSTLQYIWDTQNTTEPTSVWTAFATGDTLSKTGDGTYYLWIKASDIIGNNVVTKSDVFTVGFIEEPDEIISTIQTEHKTFAGTTTGFAHNNPVIPAGFVGVNTTRAKWNNLSVDYNNGLVIQDVSGNQFVWVPVDGTSVPYAKWDGAYTYISTTDDTLPTGITSESTQINTYKGFYIARYEAGNASNSVVSKKDANIWNSITYTNAKATSQAMYTSAKVKSGLVTGTMWDTTMKWIQNSGKSVTDGRAWGNYSDSIAPANVENGILQTTGYSNNWQAKNIYDLAGNVWEWTNEKLGVYNFVYRGGPYCYSGVNNYPPSFRSANGATYTFVFVGFRLALYII